MQHFCAHTQNYQNIGTLYIENQTDMVNIQSQRNTVMGWPIMQKTERAEADMEFVKNFIPPDFQAKNFTPSISPNFNSFSKKKHKK